MRFVDTDENIEYPLIISFHLSPSIGKDLSVYDFDTDNTICTMLQTLLLTTEFPQI